MADWFDDISRRGFLKAGAAAGSAALAAAAPRPLYAQAATAPAWRRSARLGRMVHRGCAVCHTVIERVRDKSGPNLHGVVGRTAGSDEYLHGYSDELVASGVIWQVSTIQAFINSPALMIRGTKMVFRGLPDFETRLDIACYLERFSNDETGRSNELCIE